MKTNLNFFVGTIIVLFLLIPSWSNAARPGGIIIFQVAPEPTLENEETPTIPPYHRIPPRPVECSISQETGLSIPNVDNSEIILYEVYDEYETCIATFDPEDDFINFIYSYEGGVIIKIYTQDHVYSGYISE